MGACSTGWPPLPPPGFVTVLALGAGLLVLRVVRLAAGAGRPALPPKPGAFTVGDAPGQDAADVQCLVATLRALDVRDPGRRPLRDELPATLAAQASGRQVRRQG